MTRELRGALAVTVLLFLAMWAASAVGYLITGVAG